MNTPRHIHTEDAYREFKNSVADTDAFDFSNETVIREFTHWVIIKNRFPYDTMVRTNDMLVSRNKNTYLYDCSPEEQNEYHEIIKQLSEEAYYDALIDNFPKARSVKKHTHIHLVQWHNSAQ